MKLYFTYNKSETMPYQSGWTEIEAPNRTICMDLFKSIHPSTDIETVDEKGIVTITQSGSLNCDSIYDGHIFETTYMFENGNLGHRAHEIITVNIESVK